MSFHYWLLLGFACMLAEALGASGIGLFFAGLGAVIVGIVQYIYPLHDVAQFALFFAATALAAAVLWKPLQRFPLGKPGEVYSNMVGDTVEAVATVTGERGQVRWSGTVMNAQLSKQATVDSLPAGSLGIIQTVSGNTLIILPK